MNYFVDIRVLPDPEFHMNQIMSTLFRKLHQVLVQLGSKNIGVSFPQHKQNSLGGKLRLHGSDSELQNLLNQNWLVGMIDHINISPLCMIPTGTKFRVVYRVQAKSNPERLRRRAMRRHGISIEEAARRIPDSAEETLALPFLQLSSTSTKQRFPLFVCHGPILEQPHTGSFSSYGFSPLATVPWF